MDKLRTNNVFLEKMRFVVSQMLTKEMIEDVTVIEEHLSDVVTLQIRGFVWAEDVGTEFVRYPADWWQAFKDRWFPEWALNKWPVRYSVWTLNIKAAYPDFHPALHREQVRYKVVYWNGEEVDK